MNKWVPMLVEVTSKVDVNGNTYFRCKSNRIDFKPKTIKHGYSREDAARCYIKQFGINFAIAGESHGFNNASTIFVIEIGN